MAAQEDRLRAYCAMRGIEVAELVIDAGVSGGIELSGRAGGSRLLAAIRAGRAGAVVALKLDRLFRDASDCLATTKAWDRAGVALHLVDLGGQAIDTSSTMGRFFLTMMAGVAEMEKNMIGDRTRTALQHKRSRGERVGSVPYGFALAADGIHLEQDEAEREVIALVKELRSAGMSLRKIGDRLTASGAVPRNGGAWHPQTVANIAEAGGTA